MKNLFCTILLSSIQLPSPKEIVITCILFTLSEIVSAFTSIYSYIFFGAFVNCCFMHMVRNYIHYSVLCFSHLIYLGHQLIQYIEYLFLKAGRYSIVQMYHNSSSCFYWILRLFPELQFLTCSFYVHGVLGKFIVEVLSIKIV